MKQGSRYFEGDDNISYCNKFLDVNIHHIFQSYAILWVRSKSLVTSRLKGSEYEEVEITGEHAGVDLSRTLEPDYWVSSLGSITSCLCDLRWVTEQFCAVLWFKQ